VATNGSGTTGVAPLIVDDTAAGRIVRFAGDGRADYCDLLAADNPSTLTEIVQAIKDYGRWDMVDLGNVPGGAPTADLLRAICERAGLHMLVDDQFVCPTLVIRGHEHEAQRIASKPSLRRRQHYFERLGNLNCQDLSTAADVEPHLDAFFAQHIARWEGSGTPSLFHDPLNRAFYRELTARLDGTSWLLFSQVQLDDRPIAIHYGFDYDGCQLWYKPSFDPAFSAGSPGVVLVQHLIRRALETGRREFDFTIGDEPFKWRFTNFARKTVRIRIFRDPGRYFFERSKRSVLAAVRLATGRIKAR
jgi:CelD/BcsL family acetyltransferase involved in cellulose biosynthesis